MSRFAPMIFWASRQARSASMVSMPSLPVPVPITVTVLRRVKP